MAMGKLRTIFKKDGGTVTAGNASGMCGAHELGLVSLCIGGGQGIALLLARE